MSNLLSSNQLVQRFLQLFVCSLRPATLVTMAREGFTVEEQVLLRKKLFQGLHCIRIPRCKFPDRDLIVKNNILGKRSYFHSSNIACRHFSYLASVYCTLLAVLCVLATAVCRVFRILWLCYRKPTSHHCSQN